MRVFFYIITFLYILLMVSETPITIFWYKYNTNP